VFFVYREKQEPTRMLQDATKEKLDPEKIRSLHLESL